MLGGKFWVMSTAELECLEQLAEHFARSKTKKNGVPVAR
jgi:hypothetical protein